MPEPDEPASWAVISQSSSVQSDSVADPISFFPGPDAAGGCGGLRGRRGLDGGRGESPGHDGSAPAHVPKFIVHKSSLSGTGCVPPGKSQMFIVRVMNSFVLR